MVWQYKMKPLQCLKGFSKSCPSDILPEMTQIQTYQSYRPDKRTKTDGQTDKKTPI